MTIADILNGKERGRGMGHFLLLFPNKEIKEPY